MRPVQALPVVYARGFTRVRWAYMVRSALLAAVLLRLLPLRCTYRHHQQSGRQTRRFERILSCYSNQYIYTPGRLAVCTPTSTRCAYNMRAAFTLRLVPVIFGVLIPG